MGTGSQRSPLNIEQEVRELTESLCSASSKALSSRNSRHGLSHQASKAFGNLFTESTRS